VVGFAFIKCRQFDKLQKEDFTPCSQFSLSVRNCFPSIFSKCFLHFQSEVCIYATVVFI
jgi:hypothetical protein